MLDHGGTPVPCVSPVDLANARIRAYCAGRAVWSPAALAELARLRAAWNAAREAEAVMRQLGAAA